MSSINRVILMGNLTRDPVLKRLGTGTAVAELGLAINERTTSKNGEETTSVCFVDVVAWSKQAESCAEYLAKGSCVLVEGRLQLDAWQDKQGQKHSRLRVRADRVQFISRPAKTEEDRSEEDAPPAPVPTSGKARFPTVAPVRA